MNEQLQQYLEAIKASYCGSGPGDSPVRQEMVNRFTAAVTVSYGSKYIKVLTNDGAHSFIVAKDTLKFKAGDILMAKSYSSPATNFSRGNILDPKFNFSTVRWTGAWSTVA